MKRHTKPHGRLLGGLLHVRGRIGGWCRRHLAVADVVYTVIAALVGSGVGLLFAAMWIR